MAKKLLVVVLFIFASIFGNCRGLRRRIETGDFERARDLFDVYKRTKGTQFADFNVEFVSSAEDLNRFTDDEYRLLTYRASNDMSELIYCDTRDFIKYEPITSCRKLTG